MIFERRSTRAALFALSVLFSSGCASTPAGRVDVARGVSFELLSPATFGSSVALDQVVTFRSREGSRSMHCALEIEPHELRLVGLTPFETPAFRITLGADGLVVEHLAGESLPTDPRIILADLQLALWPDLPTHERFEVREATEFGTWTRELLHNDGVFVRVRRPSGAPWSSPLEFEHIERGYALTVETLRCETLAP